MKFISVCSGIEAVSVATNSLGWEALAVCEFDRFPSSVLAHHWPDVPNLGDMTKWREWPAELLNEADILAGGTPCHAFSIAGLRNSLADERGNLTLTYVHILDQIDKIRARNGRPPAVCLWENVPGVLNTDDNAFGCFLAALAGEDEPLQPPGGRWTDAGYVRGPLRTIAWRSLDAQYFGLAQRRQRVFVVASAGEGFRPEEILFEFEGVRRDSPPRRETGEGVTGTLSARTEGGGGLGTDFELGGGLKAESFAIQAGALRENPSSGPDGVGVQADIAYTIEARPEVQAICLSSGQAGAEIGIGIGTTLTCLHEAPIVTQEVTHALTAEGHDASEDGTGRGTPCIAFERRFVRTTGGQPSIELNGCLRADENSGDGAPCVAFDNPTMAVRRLMPIECARLQGLPDSHCEIPYRGKPSSECPDGPQYKAYGNSMAVPVISWICTRIQSHCSP